MKIIFTSTNPIIPIIPISPIKKKKQQETRKKGIDIISDENLGQNVDITVKGPLKTPNCFNCVFYYDTYYFNFPHGCKKFNFKKWNELPSLTVYEATGCHCRFFEEKQKMRK